MPSNQSKQGLSYNNHSVIILDFNSSNYDINLLKSEKSKNPQITDDKKHLLIKGKVTISKNGLTVNNGGIIMIGRVLRVTKDGGVVQGTISTQNGTEYKFFSPSIYVRPKFIVEFNIVESDGTEFAQLIKQTEIEYPPIIDRRGTEYYCRGN